MLFTTNCRKVINMDWIQIPEGFGEMISEPGHVAPLSDDERMIYEVFEPNPNNPLHREITKNGQPYKTIYLQKEEDEEYED